MHRLLLTILLFFLQDFTYADETLTVKLPKGDVEGYIKETVKGKKFVAFEGVPYAQPPVGENRFRCPKPIEPWPGVWQAKTTFKCIQYDHFTPYGQDMVSGDEDCLYLNIYTPDVNPAKKYDVLVYIHGGAFIFGNGGAYVPTRIMDRDIVYVNINYRLGTLGFLSTEDKVLPGNLGLRDQQMALRWVKENIHHFGGNPDSVTIGGTSAGGASTELHYILPKSKGLFHRGISMSGCVLNPWVIVENPLEKTKKVAEIVGCTTGNKEKMVECLKRKPARQLVHTIGKLQPWIFNPFTPIGPVIDKWASDPVLPDHPYKLLKEGKVHDLPWIISFTNDEGLYPGADFYNDELLEHLDKNWNELMPHILHYTDTVNPKDMKTVGEKIRKEYLGDKKLNKGTFSNLIQALGDRLFTADIEKAARLHSAAVKSPVYHYKFTYEGSRSVSSMRSNTTKFIGVSHGDDTCYIFPFMDIVSTSKDERMSDMLIDMITVYIKTGKPGITDNWRPLSKNVDDPLEQLLISSPDDVKMIRTDMIGNRKFWDSLPFAENDKIFTIKDEL